MQKSLTSLGIELLLAKDGRRLVGTGRLENAKGGTGRIPQLCTLGGLCLFGMLLTGGNARAGMKFFEEQVGAKPVVWFEAGDATTTDWPDKSGNGRDAVKVLGDPNPVANVINGKAVVEFRKANGDDEYLLQGEPFIAKEHFYVFRSPNDKFNNYGGILGHPNGRGSNYLFENNQSYFHSNQRPSAVTKNGVDLADPFDMGTLTDFMVLRVEVNNGNLGPHAGYKIGEVDNNYSNDLDVAEIVAFDTVLTTDQRQRMEGFLAVKYGLQASLPVDHPYNTAWPTVSLVGADFIRVQKGTAFTDPGVTASDPEDGVITDFAKAHLPQFEVSGVDVGGQPVPITGLTVKSFSSEYDTNRLAVDTINGAGLTNGLHDVDQNNMWMTTGGTTAEIVYDLGQTYDLAGLHVWNFNMNNGASYTDRGANFVEMWVDTDPSGNSFVSVGTYVFAQAPGTPGYAGEDIDISNELAALKGIRLVKFDIQTTHGGAYVGLSEVQFSTYPPISFDAVDTDLTGDWTIKYTAADSNGQTASVERTVRIFDPDGPVITLDDGVGVHHEQGTPFVGLGYSVKDKDGNPVDTTTNKAVVTGTVDPDVPGEYELTYNFTDDQGRKAEPVDQTVTVSDTVAPVINLTGGNTIKLPSGQKFIDPGALGTDAVDGVILATSSLYTPNKILMRGFHGNMVDEVLVFDGNGGMLLDVPRGETYLDQSLSFNGDSTFQLPGTNITSGDRFRALFLTTFAARLEGTYEFGVDNPDDRASFWMDLDQDGIFEIAEGEWMNEGYRGGYKTVDLKPGYYKVAIGFLENTGGSRIDAKFRAPKGAGPDILLHLDPTSQLQDGLWVEPAPFDNYVPGTYTITYTATDLAGNTSTATRTVEVSADLEPPVLSLLGRPVIKHPVDTDFTDPGVKLEGPAGEDLSAELPNVAVTGTVDTAVPGEYELFYSYTGQDQVPAVTIRRFVRVVDDVAPTIELVGDAAIEYNIGEVFTDPGLTVTDNHDTTVPWGSTAEYPANNLWLHVDASQIKGIEPGDTVPLWANLLGNGNELSDVYGKPTLVADAINGMPAVRVDGDDYMAITTDIQRVYSVFTVSQIDANNFGTLMGSVNSNWSLGYYDGYQDVFQNEAGWVTLQNETTVIPVPHLYSATSNNGVSRFWADGKDKTFVQNINGRMLKFQIGRFRTDTTRYATGSVAEVLIYNNYVVNEGEKLSIEYRLGTKYKLPGFPDHTPPDLSTPGDYTILYIARDSSGNVSYATRDLKVNPNPALPVIALTGGLEIVHEAGTVFTDPGHKITDSGGTEQQGEAAAITGTVDKDVPGLYEIRYNYTDGSGNVAEEVVRTVLVADNTAPVISLTGDTEIRLVTGTPFAEPGGTATDSFDPLVTIDITHARPVAGWVPGLLGGTLSGNSNNPVTQPNPGNLGIDPLGPTQAQHTTSTAGTVWSTDMTVVYSGQIYDEDGKVSLMASIDDAFYMFVDQQQVLSGSGWGNAQAIQLDLAAGDEGWHDFEIRMYNGGGGGGNTQPLGFGIDVTGAAPTIKDPDRTLYVAPYNSDDKTMDLFRVQGLDFKQFDTSIPGTYEILYSSTDDAGNTGTSVRKLVIVDDVAAPFIVLNGESFVTLEASASATYTDPGAVAKAANGTDVLDPALVGEGTVDPTVPGSYILRYFYDGAKFQKRTVEVVDTKPPVITLTGESPTIVHIGDDFSEPGASATDALDGSVTAMSELVPLPDHLTYDVHLETYDDRNFDFADNGGDLGLVPVGSIVFRSQKGGVGLEFTSDAQMMNSHPFLNQTDRYQLLFRGFFTAKRDGEYEFETAKVDDQCTIWLDKDMDGNFERPGDLGDERLTWGNQSAVIYLARGTYRFVLGFGENGGGANFTALFRTPPGAGPESMTVINPLDPEQAGIWSAAGKKLDTSVPGFHQVAYSAIDKAGNSTTVYRDVLVQENPNRPVLLLVGDSEVTKQAGKPYKDLGVLLEDAQGNPLDETLVTVENVPTGFQTGTFEITYSFTDAQGNAAKPLFRSVNIIDTVPPLIEIIGEETVTVSVGQPYTDPGATARDLLDGEVEVYSDVSGYPKKGLVLHLDAGSYAGTLQDGEVITTAWEDLSGKGYHADKILGDPTWTASSTHGKPAVTFDGTEDFMYTTKDFFNDLRNYTVFAIARYTGGGDQRVISSVNQNWLVGYHSGCVTRYYANGWITNNGGTDMVWHFHIGDANDRDQQNFWMDGVQLTSNSSGADNFSYMPRQIALGGFNINIELSKCEISELLIYDRILHETEREFITHGLDSKYGLSGVVQGSFPVGPVDTSATGEKIVHYFASDKAGNASIAERKVIVVDTPLPVIVLTGDPIVEHTANQPYTDAGASLTDDQGNTIPGTLVPIDKVDSGTPGEYTYTYTYNDGQGNQATPAVRIVKVFDRTAPDLQLLGGDTVELQTGNRFKDPGFTVSDDEDPDVKVTVSTFIPDEVRIRAYQEAYNYSYLDLHMANSLLSFPPVKDTFFSKVKYGDVAIQNNGELGNLWPDIPDTNVQLVLGGHFYSSGGGTYEFGIEQPDDRGIFYIDLDGDGKFEIDGDRGDERMNDQLQFGYRVVDLGPGYHAYAIAFLQGGGGASFRPRFRAIRGAGPTSLSYINPNDPLQKGLWIQYNPVNSKAPGEKEVTYIATDSAGNSITLVRKVIVRSNPDASVIHLTGDAEVTITVGGTYTEDGSTLTDLEGNTVPGSATFSGIVDTTRPGRYTLEYDYTDAQGVSARTVKRIVNVVDDVEPAITLVGGTAITHFLGTPFVDPGFSALDNYDGNLPVGTSEFKLPTGLLLHLDASRILGVADGAKVSEWSDLSGNGNHANQAYGNPILVSNALNGRAAVRFDGLSRMHTMKSVGFDYSIITVSRLSGASNQRLLSSLDQNWLLGYSTGAEDVMSVLNGWVNPTGKPASTRPHVYSATSANRAVKFYSDSRDITVFGSRRDNNYEMGIFQMGAYAGGLEAATGDVAEVLIFDHVLPKSQRQGIEAILNAKYSLNGLSGINFPVDPNKLGEYHIVYQAIDNAGNLATVVRTVNVVPDPAAPVITLVGDAEIHHEAGAAFADPGVTLKDFDGTVLDPVLVVVDNAVQANVPGQYTITYNYETDRGKVAGEVTRRVFVEDTLPPVITLLGDEVVKVEVGGTYTEAGATATDQASGNVFVSNSLQVVQGALHHWGFKDQNNSAALELDANGGLLAATPGGTALLTDGVGRGLDFSNSNEFFSGLEDIDGNTFPPQGDWFQMLFHGVFIAPVDGEYELGFIRREYETTLWLDLNQNGTFETAEGERLMNLTDTGFRKVTLQAGYYNFAAAYRENNGSEYITVGVALPGSGKGQVYINPASQLGLWGIRDPLGLDTTKAGSHTVFYAARDQAGHIAIKERTVIVVDDASLPFISLNGGLEIVHEAGKPFTDPGAVVKDDSNQVLVPSLLGQGTVDITTLGEYTLTYDYNDGQNDAATIVRTVIVVDTQGPELTLVQHPLYGGTAEVRLKAGRKWEDPGVTIQDADPDAFWVSDRKYLPNRLEQSGYNLAPVEEFVVNFQDNGGLMAMPKKASAYFTSGPGGKGYDYTTDADFRSLPIGIERDQDYGMLTQGYFRAKVAGRYEFRTDNTDRYQALWMDLDQDGNFSRTGRLGDERLTYRDGTGRVDLDPGFYRVALGYATYYGNRARAWVMAPFGGGPSGTFSVIKPTDPVQNGLWFAEGKGDIDTTQPGEYTITYHASDKWGNVSTLTRKVVVEADLDAPVLTLVGDAELVHEQGTDYTDVWVTAKDSGGGDLDATKATSLVTFGGHAVALVDGSIPGDYTVRYDFVDSQGRPAVPLFRKVSVMDTTPPDITLNGNTTVYASPGAPYLDLGATALDAVDGNVKVTLTSTSPQPGYVPGLQFGTDYGNLSTLANPGNLGIDPLGPTMAQKSTNPPWIDDYTFIYTGEIYDDDGIFSFREAIGDKLRMYVDGAMVIDSNTELDQLEAKVDLKFGGWFPFEVRMSSNAAAPYGAMENLGLGFDPDGGDQYLQPKNSSPATMDRFRVKTLMHNTVDTVEESTQTITFTATDAAGNTSTLVRTVIVKEDPLKPILKWAGEPTIVLEATTPFDDPVLTMEDARGNAITGETITQNGEVDVDIPGVYTLTFNASHNGRDAAPLTIQVEVVDTTPPAITVIGANPLKVEKGSVYADPGAKAFDLLDGAIPLINNLEFISNGLELHLDASSLSLNDGDAVNLWPDLSPAGNSFDKTNGSPTFVASSSHGKPAVSFDGNDQIYSNHDFQPNLEYTILSVARYTGGQDGRVISSISRNWFFGFHASRVRAFYSDAWLYQQAGTDTNWHLHAGHAIYGGIGSFWMDDEHLADSIPGLHPNQYRPIQISLGAYQTLNEASKCEVSEILYYNRILSGAERNVLFAYLNSKYGINGGGEYFFGAVDTSIEGTHKVFYRTTDNSGNEAVAVREVLVVDQPDLPVISLLGDVQATHGSGQPYVDAGAEVKDGQGNVIQGAVPVVTGAVDTDIPGDYVLAYDYDDGNGNSAATVLRTVTVTDQSPPVITLAGGDTYVHQMGNPFEDPGYSAWDAGDGKVTVSTSQLTSDSIRLSYYTGQNGNLLDITNSGGLLTSTPDIVVPHFVTAPARMAGLYLDGNDFKDVIPNIPQEDNFMVMCDGYFRTKTGGRYEFGIENPDDQGRFYLDLDQDGVFEINGDRGPEQMNALNWYGYREVDLDPGFYKFAVLFLEGGGGQRIDARYRAIQGAGPPIVTRIYPGQVDQKGQWVQYNPINTLGGGEYDITYTATDSKGNTATATRHVIVKNQPEAAVISLLGDAEMSVPFAQAFTDPGAALTDIDGNAVAGEAVVLGTVDTQTPGLYRLTYTFTNAGGFTSRQRVRKVHVVDDTPPVITLGGSANMTHFQGLPFLDPGSSAKDDHDGVLVAGSSHGIKKVGLLMHLDASSILGKADGDPVTTWLDLSGKGNHASESEGTPTYSLSGIQSRPAIYFDGFSSLSTSQYFGNTYTIFTVSRMAGGSNQRLLASGDNIDWAMGYDGGFEDYFRDGRGDVTFLVNKATTDPHLYTAASANQNINFYSDGILLSDFAKRRDTYQDIGKFQMGAWRNLEKPAKGYVSEVLIYDHVLSGLERKSVEAYLNAKYGLNGIAQANVPVNPDKPGTYSVVYEAIDSSGNRAVSTRTVTVVPNPNAPSITLTGDELVEHEAGTAFTDPGYELKDKDGNVLAQGLVVVSSDLDPDVTGLYTIRYNYAPATGQPATEMVRRVWVRDTQGPVITLNGEKDVRLKVGDPYDELGATATDIASGDLPVLNSKEWHINALLKQGFTEPRDNYQPLILDNNGGLLAATPLGSAHFTDGPTGRGLDFGGQNQFWDNIVDENGDDPTPTDPTDEYQILWSGSFFAPTEGTYEFGIEYQDDRSTIYLDINQNGIFEDAAGELIVDINLQGVYQPVQLKAGIYKFAVAFAEGGGGERVRARMSLPPANGKQYIQEIINPTAPAQAGLWAYPNTTPLDTSVAGIHTIQYLARDGGGNITVVERTVHVVDDNTVPFISLNGLPSIVHEAGDDFTDPGATVISGVNGSELTTTLQGTGTVDKDTVGVYTLAYDYNEGGKDAVQVTRQVSVVDTTKPAITLNGNASMAITAGSTFTDPGVTATDVTGNPMVVTGYIPHKLGLRAYMVDQSPPALLDFNLPGSLFDLAPSGSDFFTKGPLGTGWEYNSDAEFQRDPIGIIVNDYYQTLTTGYFYAKADGDYDFRTDNVDNYLQIWIDLDQDDVFEMPGDFGNERLTNGNQTATVALTTGFYRIALGYMETTGGARGRFQLKTPVGAGPSDALTVVKPTDPAQAGLWYVKGDPTVNTTFTGTYPITYYAIDASGNVSKVTRTVIVEPDPSAPVLHLVGEPEVAHEIGSPYNDDLPEIKDQAGQGLPGTPDFAVTLNGVDVTDVDGNVAGVYKITYTFTDGSSRSAIPIYRTVTVADTIAPVITLNGAADITVLLGSEYKDAGATASDAFDGSVTVTMKSSNPVEAYVPGLLAGTTRNWNTTTPNPGNVGIDPLGPSAAQMPSSTNYPWDVNTMVIYTGEFYDADGVFAFREDIDEIARIAIDGVQWFEDRQWNVATEYQTNQGKGGWFQFDLRMWNGGGGGGARSFGVELETEGLLGANGNWVIPQNTNADSANLFRYWAKLHDTVDARFEGDYTITYTAKDAAGNTSTAVRKISVKDDFNRPIITLAGAKVLTHEAGNPFTDPGYTVANRRGDTFDATKVVATGSIDTTKTGDYILTYNFSDAGKDAPQVTRKVTVVDTTAPVIELTGGEYYRVPVGQAYTEPGVTVTDNLDTGLTADVTLAITGLQPLVHWEFDELDGSTSPELMAGLDATLINFPDLAAARVQGKYGNALSFDMANASYLTVPGAALLDLQAFTISVWVKSDDYVRDMFIFEKTTDDSLNSQYNVHFESQNQGEFNFRINDGAGGFEDLTVASPGEFLPDVWQHIAVTYDGSVQKIYVEGQLVAELQQDITIPDTPAAGPAYIGAYAQGGGYHFHGLMDDLKIYPLEVPQALIPEIQKQAGVDTSVERKAGNPYTFTYKAQDAHGNASTVVRKVIVSNDQTPPTLTLNGQAQMNLTLGDTWSDPFATASDTIDGDISIRILVTGTVDPNKEGVYELTYDVMDLSYNQAVPVTRTVTVSAQTDPLDDWYAAKLPGHPAGDKTPTADPDHDRIPNLLEYALGGDPAMQDRKVSLPDAKSESGFLKVTFIRIQASVDPLVTYKVELTRRLKGGTWSEADVVVAKDDDQDGVPTGYERVTATSTTPIASETQGRQFIRITVERP